MNQKSLQLPFTLMMTVFHLVPTVQLSASWMMTVSVGSYFVAGAYLQRNSRLHFVSIEQLNEVSFQFKVS